MAAAVLLLLLILLVFFIYYRVVYRPHQVLKRHGIPSPPPTFFYGNLKERKKVGIMKYIEGLHKTYGPIAGYYLGTIPIISTTDLELVKMVTIKDFSNFTNRQNFPDLMRKKTTKKRSLLQSRNDTWRSARQILSPTFSTSKMKAMTPLIAESVQTLVEIFAGVADTGSCHEVWRTYGHFTLETLLATAFGRKMDIQKGESDDLVDVVSDLIGRETSQGKQSTKSRMALEEITAILSYFPWLESFFRYQAQGSTRQKSYMLLSQLSLAIIQERRKETETGKYKDLLQHMLDAGMEGRSSDGHAESQRMDDAEIASHSILFIMAGYETTANTLTFTSYLLACHPHIQEKLQAEIDNYYHRNPDTSLYQAAMGVDYLDMVIQEALRLFPPAVSISRESAKEYHYKNISIPAGAVVYVPIFLIHKDSKSWKDPDKFDPLRFTAEEKPKRPQNCHMPFGSGLRNCIGMRFALLEAKIALIELMKRFSLVKAEETEEPLETVLGITMRPKNGVHLRVVSRS